MVPNPQGAFSEPASMQRTSMHLQQASLQATTQHASTQKASEFKKPTKASRVIHYQSKAEQFHEQAKRVNARQKKTSNVKQVTHESSLTFFFGFESHSGYVYYVLLLHIATQLTVTSVFSLSSLFTPRGSEWAHSRLILCGVLPIVRQLSSRTGLITRVLEGTFSGIP